MGSQTLNRILLVVMFFGLGLIALLLVRREQNRLKKALQALPPISTEPVTKSIEVLLPDKSVVEGELLLWDCDPQNVKVRRITLRFSGREFSNANHTYFQALNEIRRELENEQILLKCYGCSRNVWPSGMCLSMGTGGKAYKTFLGKAGEGENLVSIFDSGPDVDSCTYEEQKSFHDQWALSIRNSLVAKN